MNSDIAVPLLLSRVRRLKVPLQGPLLVALAYLLGAEAAFYIGTLSDQIFALFWMPAPQLLVAFVTNCMVALLNAYAVRRFVGDPPWFGNFREACIYIVITAGIAPAVSALGGAFVPILGGGALEDYWIFWSHWYLANAL